MIDKSCILFYVKFPENGKVKTRLAKDIGDEHAAALYKCFILDMLETFAATAQHVCICYSPENAEQAFKTWLGEKYLYLPQHGRDLGARMHDSFQQAFRHGFKHVAIIGSDLPDLPSQIILEAFEKLRAFDTVIGPTVDGGYYLLGFHHDTYLPEVFEGISWSTASVFEQTLQKIQQAGLTFSILPAWQDIDNFSELQQLYNQHQQTSGKFTNTISYFHTLKGIAL